MCWFIFLIVVKYMKCPLLTLQAISGYKFSMMGIVKKMGMVENGEWSIPSQIRGFER